MNNEETLIAQPISNGQDTEKTKKNSNKKNTAGIVVGTTIGSLMGGGVGAAAASTILHDSNEIAPKEDSNQEDLAQEESENQPINSEPQEVAVTEAGAEEPDYTEHQNADPVMTSSSEQQEAQPVSNDPEPEIKVLGVYENTTDEGIHQTAAVLTDGVEVAAVVDIDGDGKADVMAYDENNNNQIDDGEIHDISEQNIPMDSFQESYFAQQQELEQQDSSVYNTSDDLDYNNDADVSFT